MPGLSERNDANGDSLARCRMSSPQPRPMPETTCWSRRSVVRWRLESLVRMNAANSSLPGSGPSPASGPSSPGGSTHHDALRWVPCSRTSTATVAGSSPAVVKVNRATEPRGLVFLGGSSMSRRPACDRCSTIRLPSSNVPDQVLGPAPDRDEPPALERVGGRGVGLERGEAEQVGPLEDGPGQERVEALGQRLHLGQFGHATMYA